MKRLTTDKPKDNFENALNLFYIRDRETWVRGGGPGPEYADVSLFDFIRDVIKTHIPEIELPRDNDDLSMMMSEWLCDDPDTAEGVVALLYTAAWAYAELRHRLAAIENILGDKYDIDHLSELLRAEKDGELVVKPFKPGTRFILCDDPNRDIIFTGNILFEVKSAEGESEWWEKEAILADLKGLRQAGDRNEAALVPDIRVYGKCD